MFQLYQLEKIPKEIKIENPGGVKICNISQPENMQGRGRRSRNLSSNFGSRALSIVSRLQTLTGGEAKTLTNSLEFKSAIVNVMVYS